MHSDRRRRTRSRSRSRSRSLSRPRSLSRSRGDYSVTSVSNITNSANPRLVKARVFIGCLATDRVDKKDIEEKFDKYGKILGISIHRGFAFVQFEHEDDAKAACEREDNTDYRGMALDVHMVAEKTTRSRGPPRDDPYERSGRGYPPRERERSPFRRRDDFEYRRDPYRDPPPPARIRDELYDRDPYRDDPYARRPSDPYYDRPPPRDELYRRDPGPLRDDPYSYGDTRRKSPAGECEIILHNTTLREYGEYIERRLREIGIVSGIILLTDEAMLQQILDDAIRRQCRYAVVINIQNEVHRSITLNILHGTPQEHRNMPLEDALSLVARNFDSYMSERRRPSETRAPVPAPDLNINLLLTMVAEGKYVTVNQLGKIISYLEDRLKKQAELEGIVLPPRVDEVKHSPAAPSATVDEESKLLQQKVLLKQQQELQAKILSVLNKPAPAPPSPPTLVSQAPTPSVAAPTSSIGAASVSGINLDNPNIQKALENLIQTGPQLLQNLNSVKAVDAQSRINENRLTSTQAQQHQQWNQQQWTQWQQQQQPQQQQPHPQRPQQMQHHQQQQMHQQQLQQLQQQRQQLPHQQQQHQQMNSGVRLPRQAAPQQASMMYEQHAGSYGY